MEERGRFKPVGFCMEGAQKARLIIFADRKASGPEEALQMIRERLAISDKIQGPLAEIIDRVMERYFAGPKF
jgi:hypothetical protein